MLDPKFIRKNIDEVRHSIEARQLSLDINEVIAADDARKAAAQKIEGLRAEANKIAKAMPKASPEEKQALIDRGTELKRLESEFGNSVRSAEIAFNELLLKVPNLMAPDTPIGKDDHENVVVRTFGQRTLFPFKPKDHLELGCALDIVDFDAGTKVAGHKFYFLKNEGAELEIALQNYAIAKAKAAGFSFVRTPDLARSTILQGSGFSPRGENSNIYRIEGEDLNLIATSEITIGGMLSDRMYSREKLPERYVGLSHCFRMEAGAGGQSSKGLYRVHQFSKVELYILSDPDESEKHLQEILAIEEGVFRDLNIPHQVVRICSGDLGSPAYKKYDIEAWMPGKGEAGEYGEVTSAGNFTDFQARRLNIRYQDKDGKTGYAHTLNGTAIATTRAMLAIFENFQTAEGGIVIPEVLRPYMGIEEIKPRDTTPSFKAIKSNRLEL